MEEEIKTREVELDGETFTIVPVFPRKSNLRGIPLLRHVRELILEEPKRINMAVPQVRTDDNPDDRKHYLTDDSDMTLRVVEEFPPCNTVGCVAGWGDAVVLGGTAISLEHREWPEVELRADEHFQFNEYGVNSVELYFVHYWPYDLRGRYIAAEKVNNHEEMARITAERIDRFIEEMEANSLTSV
jgi:hypothetical protein